MNIYIQEDTPQNVSVFSLQMSKCDTRVKGKCSNFVII